MKRRYPERLAPSKLSISRSYMLKESQKRETSVESWVLDYLRRNKLTYQTTNTPEKNEHLEINFPSAWRQKFFILKGNAQFPYFEFH
jgi:hypothetical protein